MCKETLITIAPRSNNLMSNTPRIGISSVKNQIVQELDYKMPGRILDFDSRNTFMQIHIRSQLTGHFFFYPLMACTLALVFNNKTRKNVFNCGKCYFKMSRFPN